MIDVAERIRRVAAMAGKERSAQVDLILAREPVFSRGAIEAVDTRELAEACVLMCAELEVETEAHSRRLAARMRLFAETVGVASEDVAQWELGALLHDVGKISVEDEVLGSPVRVSGSELDRIRMHSSLGHAILFGIPALRGAVELVLAHHEYWDGTGYPGGLEGDAIPSSARMFTIVDSYDAMLRRDRGYRSCVSHETAFAELRWLAGRKYDPELVRALDRVPESAWLAIGAQYPDRDSLGVAV